MSAIEPDDPAVRDMLRRSMVARVATLSRNGRPCVNPIYFVHVNGRIWVGTVDWTLAARNVKGDPRVSILFEIETDPTDRRLLRIRGRAIVRTDKQAKRAYSLRVTRKYVMTPGGIHNYLTHTTQLRAMHIYHAQNAARGRACVIEITPEHAELI